MGLLAGANAFSRITPNPALVVKRHRPLIRLVGLLPFAFMGCAALGLPPEIAHPPATRTPAEAPTPVGIRAQKFKVRVVRSNASKRVYLFDDLSSITPPVGKIFLLKKDGSPVMAFRTLKIYESRTQIAARKLRAYGNDQLDAGSEYSAIEKLGDVFSTALSDADKADLQELENPDSKKPKNEPAQPAPATATEIPLEDFPDDEELIGKEIPTLDIEKNWLSANFGVLTNYDLTTNAAGQSTRGNSVNYAGLGLRYARTVSQMLLFDTKSAQDSLAIDGGFYYYRVVNYTPAGDSYNVMPIVLTARYNLFFGETFGAFAYLGLLKNYVLIAQSATPTAIDNLSSLLPAAGVGLLFRIGPSWMLRADLGIELLGAGLVLRF